MLRCFPLLSSLLDWHESQCGTMLNYGHFFINKSYSKIFHPSLVACIIIKRKLPMCWQPLWSLWVIIWKRPHFKGWLYQLSGTLGDLRSSCVEICMLCVSLEKGYKNNPRNESLYHTHYYHRPDGYHVGIKVDYQAVKKKLGNKTLRAWFVCMSHLKNESNDFCSSP